ncbi:MAG: HlyD family efflux transporter periplasmic adaptor subunit [Acidobacteria bacterium]|nr:HlyD family efflux transporter periplasmic adaptor subunit [Acidobacteriota bacterium]
MKKTTWWIAAVAAVGALAALGLTASAAKKTAAAAARPAAAPDRASAWIAAAGRVEPAGEEVKAGAEIDGKLARVLVGEGDNVRRGQVLAILENADYAARVELARAQLADRQAELEKLRNGAREEDKLEAAALLREAEAQASTARAERDRRLTLRERGAVSKSECDLAARDYETALARVEALRQRLAVVRQQTRYEDLKRAEAAVAQARASILESEAMLAKTVVRSPLDGRVLRRYRKAGESVSGNGDTPIVSLGDVSRLHVRVDVDENDVAKLYAGQPAWVRADAYGERKFTGHVLRIGQALGRKNVRTEEPTERVDTKILETLVELDAGQSLPVGLRVDAYLEVKR